LARIVALAEQTMPETAGPEGRVVVAAHVHVREFDGELILLHLEHGDYFALNSVGARMWRELENGSSPVEVAGLLAGEYEATEEQLTKDCVALVDSLLARHLVVRRTL
jgi:hypothetical protein